MSPIRKYPRTPHVTGSRVQRGDDDMKVIPLQNLAGLTLVIEEKLDGSNCGLSFSEDGTLILQSRGHVLTGGPRERQFDLLKRWASHHREVLRRILGLRYLMYGEWLYARHTIPYDQLPHYFLEFDIWDRYEEQFLSTGRRKAMLAGSPVISVPVLAVGTSLRLDEYIGQSRCSSSETMEGLYLKHEEHGRVSARYKFVKSDFLQAVEDSGEHWMDRPIEPNQLRNGVNLFE